MLSCHLRGLRTYEDDRLPNSTWMYPSLVLRSLVPYFGLTQGRGRAGVSATRPIRARFPAAANLYILLHPTPPNHHYRPVCAVFDTLVAACSTCGRVRWA
jgi:hypothetical protein